MPRSYLILLVFARLAFAQASTDTEIRRGREMAARQSFVSDPEVVAFFEGLVQKLSANEAMRLPVQLGVISAGAGVASALPGGYALVSAGAIRDASTEAEAAALLAHAIGHVQAGTPVRVVNSVPIIFSGEFGACVREKKGTPRVLVPQYLLGTPDQEVQADLVALQLLNKAGYDPDALLTVFHRWGKRHAPAAEIRQQAAALRVGTQIVDSSEFERIRARLAPTARPSPTLRSLSRP